MFTYSTPLAKLRENPDAYHDGKFLADMLIELTPEQAQERALRFGVTGPYGYALQRALAGEGSFPNGLYTCRHWDEDTGLCGAYEDRPRMCRDYPYAKPCDHDGCCQYRPPMKTQIRYMPRTKVWEGDYA